MSSPQLAIRALVNRPPELSAAIIGFTHDGDIPHIRMAMSTKGRLSFQINGNEVLASHHIDPSLPDPIPLAIVAKNGRVGGYVADQKVMEVEHSINSGYGVLKFYHKNPVNESLVFSDIQMVGLSEQDEEWRSLTLSPQYSTGAQEAGLELVGTFPRLRGYANDILLTKDGKYVITDDEGEEEGVVVFNCETMQLDRVLWRDAPISMSLGMTLDDRLVYAGNRKGELFVYRFEDQKMISQAKITNGMMTGLFHHPPNSIFCVSINDDIQITRLNGVRALDTISIQGPTRTVAANRKIMVLGGQSFLKAIDIASKKPAVEFEDKGFDVFATAISQDGQTVLAGGRDPNIYAYDLKTGKVIQSFSGHEELVRDLKYIPGTRCFLSASYDRTARIWNIDTGEELYRVTMPVFAFTELAVRRDGKQFVSVGGQFHGRAREEHQKDLIVYPMLWNLPANLP